MIFLTLACSFIFYWFFFKAKSQDSFFFKCESDVLYDVHYIDGNVTLDASYALVLGKGRNGFLQINGVVKKDGHKSNVDRIYYFNYEKNEKVGVYKVKFFREKIRASDTTNTQLFHSNFLPDKPGEEVYIKASYIEYNVYFIEGFSSPYFMCTTK